MNLYDNLSKCGGRVRPGRISAGANKTNDAVRRNCVSPLARRGELFGFSNGDQWIGAARL